MLAVPGDLFSALRRRMWVATRQRLPAAKQPRRNSRGIRLLSTWRESAHVFVAGFSRTWEDLALRISATDRAPHAPFAMGAATGAPQSPLDNAMTEQGSTRLRAW